MHVRQKEEHFERDVFCYFSVSVKRTFSKVLKLTARTINTTADVALKNFMISIAIKHFNKITEILSVRT